MPDLAFSYLCLKLDAVYFGRLTEAEAEEIEQVIASWSGRTLLELETVGRRFLELYKLHKVDAILASLR